MPRPRLVLSAAVAMAAFAAGAAGVVAAPVSAPYVVLYRDRVDVLEKTLALERAHGFRAKHRYTAAVKGFAARLSPAQRERVGADPDVVSIHDDREVRLIVPRASARVRSSASGVRRVEGGAKAAAVAIAVLDTGVDLTHPALNVESGVTCLAGRRRHAPARDENGHGTHVAGTIAARDAGQGAIGVAPGSRLYAVKVLDAQGRGSASQLICGIDWVTASAERLGIRVANVSLGTSGEDDGACGRRNGDPVHQAICRSVAAGVTYVVAAGNGGTDLARSIPAAYEEVLAVTAMADSDGRAGRRGAAPACKPDERDETAASFSNYARSASDATHTIAAPGVCIASTWPGGRYRTLSGTSMAAPHVSGTVALCISSGKCTGSPAEVIHRLRADAETHASPRNGYAGDPQAPVRGRYYGYLLWAGAY